MLKELEFFLARLSGIFDVFLRKILVTQLSAAHSSGVTSNEHFLLRGYLSFVGNTSGDEVALTVDVRLVNGILSIEADVVGENGQIISAGPTLTNEFTNWVSDQKICDQYLHSLEDFLSNEYTVIAKEISKLE